MEQASTQRLLSQANTQINNGQSAEAAKLLYTLVRQYPQCYKGWLLFSRSLFEVGHIQEAVQIAQHAEQVDPLQRQFQQIQRCMQQGKLDDAAQLAKQMLGEQPHHPKACFTLASIALADQQPEQSIELLVPAVKELPANITLRKLLSDSYVRAGHYALAINAAECLTRLDPGFESLWNLLLLYFKYGQYNELLAACEQAPDQVTRDCSKQSQIELIQGQVLRILGRREDSIRYIKASLQSNPQNTDAWWALADFKNYTFSEAEREQLARLQKAGLSAHSRCRALFTAAKVSEQDGDSTLTMALYNQANTLKAPHGFTPQGICKDLTAIRHAYTPAALAGQAESTINQATPIFIVGLPRSGTTLLEQMLASHSQIEGTLEQPTLAAIERRMQRYVRSHYQKNLNDSLELISARDLTSFGRAYIEQGRLFRQQHCAFFIDKQPFNFRHTGLIHKILPKAVIIDMRRNPMDCGWSLFKQYFQSGVDFSYRLDHIGTVYNAYVDLMMHWQNVLPERVLTVNYEELVAAPEQQLKRVFQHIGLNYEPGCLAYYNSDRAVHTASSEQVREPVNRNGIGAWREFESGLDALKRSLRPDILEKYRLFDG